MKRKGGGGGYGGLNKVRGRARVERGEDLGPEEGPSIETSGTRGFSRSGKLFRRTNRPHYATLDALKRAHRRIFEPSARLFLIDRPVVNRTVGLAEANLRMPASLASDPVYVKAELKKAVAKLLSLYPEGGFETVVTANAITQGPPEDTPSYSIYYGQDAAAGGERSVKFNDVVVINTVSDVSQLPLTFGLEDFGKIFFKTYRNTKVRLHSLANVVVLFRKLLADYQADKKTAGQTHTLLY